VLWRIKPKGAPGGPFFLNTDTPAVAFSLVNVKWRWRPEERDACEVIGRSEILQPILEPAPPLTMTASSGTDQKEMEATVRIWVQQVPDAERKVDPPAR